VEHLKNDQLKNLPDELRLAKELVYDPCDFVLSDFNTEPESADYAACKFLLNKHSIVYRVSKITPTKVGQFVTVWKRKQGGPIEPYDSSDHVDFIIIGSRAGHRFGQFIFPKAVLLEKGILSRKNQEGKRGIRIYPPWDKAINKQAQKTQAWQLAYFLEIPLTGAVDFVRAKQLIGFN